MKMRLTLTVDYKDGTITEQEAKTCLTAVVFDSASKGLFTGPGPGEVEDWEYKTERLSDELQP